MSTQVAGNQRTLVVTADDFGFGQATSAGIIQAHLHGPVGATSVMVVTGDHVKCSLGLLAEAPNLDVGLHLVFTDVGSRPLAATRASGLVARDGHFFSNGRLWFRAWTRRLDPTGVFDEICAQAEMFAKLTGRAHTHVDGHHHAHQLPVIRQALARAMAAGVLVQKTRVTIEPPDMLKAVPGARPKRRIIHTLGNSAAKHFRRQGILTNDYYFGVLASADPSDGFPWSRYLTHLPESGLIEWMVHPGLPDDSLIGRDTYLAGRVRELEALTNPAWRQQWASLEIKRRCQQIMIGGK